MYKIRATDHRGAAVTFACGTADQAFERVLDLVGRGFTEIRITDPGTKEWSAADFRRQFDE